MLRSCTRILATIAILALAGLATAWAEDVDVGLDFETRLAAWNQSLDIIGDATKQPGLKIELIEDMRDRLAEIEASARAAKTAANQQIPAMRRQLDALGPAPAEGEPAEADDIVTTRKRITGDIARYEAQVKQADLTVARAEAIDGDLSSYARRQTVEMLLEQFPFPLAPDTIAVALPEFLDKFNKILGSPMNWWDGLTEAERQQIDLTRIILFAVFAVLLGIVMRHFLLTRLGRDPRIEDPSYTRRLIAAVAEGSGRGMVPVLVLGAIYLRSQDEFSPVSGLFQDVVAALCTTAILLVLAWILPRAVLSPNQPDWRLLDLPVDSCRAIDRLIFALAVVYSLESFFLRSFASLPRSAETFSFVGLIIDMTQAILILALVRGRLWQLEPEEPEAEREEADESDEEAEDEPSTFWKVIRILAGSIAIAAVVADLLGYGWLGFYFISGLINSALIAGALFLLRGLGRELVGAGLRSDFLIKQLAVRHDTRQLLKFWLRAVLDVAFVVTTVIFLLPVWGVPARDLWVWLDHLLDGFRIGSVTISLGDIFTAIIVFVVILVVTRVLQRALSQRLLPRMGLDRGVQDSLSAGIGYVGVTLAILIAVAAVGLDLSNLAIIAGALSVGIGFGLQNIVNNFVSGLILLAERPIKAGDWIIAAGHEGYVKKINVRATELETFQRASVIIPNSELLSSSVVNWTHKNKLGRVEVPVGVAYGSDVDLVMKILKDCLMADERILRWPEPWVVFRGFGDSSLDFEARGFMGDVELILRIKSDLNYAINHAFAENGIEIPFPQRDLHVKNPDRLAEAMANARRRATNGEAASDPQDDRQDDPTVSLPRRRPVTPREETLELEPEDAPDFDAES